jgi:hypothetical protein
MSSSSTATLGLRSPMPSGPAAARGSERLLGACRSCRGGSRSPSEASPSARSSAGSWEPRPSRAASRRQPTFTGDRPTLRANSPAAPGCFEASWLAEVRADELRPSRATSRRQPTFTGDRPTLLANSPAAPGCFEASWLAEVRADDDHAGDLGGQRQPALVANLGRR